MIRADENEKDSLVIELQTKNVKGRKLFKDGHIWAACGFTVVFVPPIDLQTWQGYEFMMNTKDGAD